MNFINNSFIFKNLMLKNFNKFFLDNSKKNRNFAFR